ncbi:MAG TPA: glycosyltransferase [Thermoanaerobaculia bacterium]|nr:glycosyltransferase [Thermoanaerobaculia bacterium]
MSAAPPAAPPAPPAPPPAPRTALVHDWLTGLRGGEKVLEEVCALFPGAPIHTLFHFPGSVGERLEAHPIVTSFLQGKPGIERHYRWWLPLFPAAVEDFDLGGYELVISTSHCVAKGAIPHPGAVHVCYCHSPMRYAWDQEHAYFPRRRGAAARLRGLVLAWLRQWDVASAPRVDLFVANSRFVARRIRRYYRREAAVLAPPVDVDFFTPAGDGGGGAGGPYALMVSALAPYKRVDLAIAACRAIGLPLVVVGTGPETERLRGLAGAGGPGVRFAGRVGGEELRRLYRGAACFVQPGVEDFGIASVEALACGTPVVALAEGGVLDVVEDGAHGVLYRGAGDASALAAAVDNCRRMRFNSLDLRARAETFSTAAFREGFRALIDPLLRTGRNPA